MGWLYETFPSGKTAKQFAAELFDGYRKETKYEDYIIKPTKYSLRGRVLYVLMHAFDDKGNKVGNHIALHIIAKDKKSGCWGEKAMTETHGVWTTPPPPKSWIEEPPAILAGYVYDSRHDWSKHYTLNDRIVKVLELCKKYGRDPDRHI